MPRMTGAEAIVQSVLSYGVDTIFGLPGGQLYDFFDALNAQRERLRVIVSRHEQGAAYMAFGYAHSTGRTGVYVVVPGPGLLNSTAALCTASGCNAPVLCLAGQIPAAGIGSGAGFLHELPDQLGLIRGLTKWAERIERPGTAPALVREAFQQMYTGRPRPVELEMAMDVMAEQAMVELLEPVSDYPVATADPDQIQAAARALARAERPLIMIGGGAVDAGPELLELAQTLQAPVVSFRHGRGVISDRHYLSQSYPAGHRLWATADVVLAIGTRLKYPLMYWGTTGLEIIRIDIDPTEIERIAAPAIGIVADAASALSGLIPAVQAHIRPRPSRKDELTRLKAAMHEEFSRIQPQMTFLSVIREELPDDGFFVDEITQVGFASWFGFPVYEPRHLISSGYQGTLGYGYATALGVQAAHPDKQVLQISGDGGFMYNVAELATAVRHDIGVVTVLFRDDRFGNVYRDQKTRFDNRVFGAELHNPDFVALAESFGAAAWRAPSPEQLREAIRRGFDHSGPTLIEVPVGEMASPWEFIGMPRVRPAETDR